ncbi:MAG: hypothetical protein U9Q79_08635, partial [Candidatus Hydrogenedentes bacterium]|nr:hypothetical protein [Candidatus Hydrogenedentota bacterium]
QLFGVQWTPDTAGPLKMRIEVLDNDDILTEAEREIKVSPPDGYALSVRKANHVERDGERFFTPIDVSAGKGPIDVTVHADERIVGNASSDGAQAVVEAEPWFGYYDVSVDLGTFRYDRLLVATVVETRDAELLVNGEPFLIKGTNVHGMDRQSPARTAARMRVMRDLGFNMWRGDYPARWQVDLAYELNTAYTVLAPFSCIETEEIFGRQAGPPMATSREMTRLFVQTYRDSAGVLLWNSCNEVEGETADFLWSQYPLYKRLDEYERPVHYANLYGQYYWQGQDAMGVNVYFGKGQHAVIRRPNVQKTIEVGREHGKPVFYCEFNSWWGAIQSTGAEAFRDLYVWGIDQGMSGGFQYEDHDTDRHPGVYDQGLNTHKIHNDAIREAFADAKVRVADSQPWGILLQIENKRPFHLREVKLDLAVSGRELETLKLPDITPKGTEGGVKEVTLPIPQNARGPAYSVEGDLTFITHFGFRCRVPVRDIAQMTRE